MSGVSMAEYMVNLILIVAGAYVTWKIASTYGFMKGSRTEHHKHKGQRNKPQFTITLNGITLKGFTMVNMSVSQEIKGLGIDPNTIKDAEGNVASSDDLRYESTNTAIMTIEPFIPEGATEADPKRCTPRATGVMGEASVMAKVGQGADEISEELPIVIHSGKAATMGAFSVPEPTEQVHGTAWTGPVGNTAP